MEDNILSILKEVNEDIVTYNGDNLFTAGILDSLQAVDLVLALEDGLNIDIGAEYVTEDNLKTKEAIIAMIKRIMS